MKKPTLHQRKLLRELADGAEIEVTAHGSWISTGARLHGQTFRELRSAGWLRLLGGLTSTARYVITDAGREAIR